MSRLFLKILSKLNLDLAVQFYFRYFCFCKKPKCILGVFSRWKAEAELSKPIAKKIQIRNSLDGFFLKIGIVLDIWDYNADRWSLHALLQVAKHYSVTPREALENYQIVVTPFCDHNGRVWARRQV